MPDENGVVQFKDFTSQLSTVRFKVGDYIFDALPVIPLGAIEELATLSEGIKSGSNTSRLEQIVKFFEIVLTDESAAKFRLMAQDRKSPLGLKQIKDIMEWIMEVYGLRPTQAPSDSLDGSDGEETSTPSTDGAPETE